LVGAVLQTDEVAAEIICDGRASTLDVACLEPSRFERGNPIPTAGVLFRPEMVGKYHTVYSGHWRSATKWSRYRATTRAHRC